MIARLAHGENLTRDEWTLLLSVRTEKTAALLFRTARRLRERFYGKRVFLRGAVELGSFSQKDGSCFRAGSCPVSEKLILSACQKGYQTGFRSFVLKGCWEKKQGTEAFLAALIKEMKKVCPDCAVTLASGVCPEETSYMWLEAGADRYLVCAEALDRDGGSSEYLPEAVQEQKQRYLRFLKKTGWQTGEGIDTSSFLRFPERLAEEVIFLRSLQPEIVEINPAASFSGVLSAEEQKEVLEMSLYLIGVMRLLLPRALLPASGILETFVPGGQELGLLCGANVLVQSLASAFCNSELHAGSSIVEKRMKLRRSVEAIGYEIVAERGDCFGFSRSVRRGLPAGKNVGKNEQE